MVKLLFGAIVSTFVIAFIIKNYRKLHLQAVPNSRSIHKKTTPTSAGIAIFLSLFTTSLIFDNDFFMKNTLFFINIFLIFLVGLIDDLLNLKANTKLLFMIIIATFSVFSLNLYIDNCGVWLSKELVLYYPLGIAITIFSIIGFTNAFNLIDGLDGLAGGIALIMLSAFLYIGLKYEDSFMLSVTLPLISAIVVFLIFNWYPAKIFLGDSGSLFLGFVISLLAIKATKYIGCSSVLFITALPIFDTLIVMIRRIKRGLNPFQADKSHIHHKILLWKTKVDFSVSFLLFVQLILTLIGLFLSDRDNFGVFILFLLFLKLFFVIFDERRVPRKDYPLFLVFRKYIFEKLGIL